MFNLAISPSSSAVLQRTLCQNQEEKKCQREQKITNVKIITHLNFDLKQ